MIFNRAQGRCSKMLQQLGRCWKCCEVEKYVWLCVNHLKESEPSQAVGDRFKRLNTFWRCKNGPFRTLLWTLLKNHDLQTNSQTAGRNLKLLEPPVMWIDETSLQVAEPHPNPSSINQLPKKNLAFLILNRLGFFAWSRWRWLRIFSCQGA